MGEAVASKRHDELARVAASVDGVVTVDELVAKRTPSLMRWRRASRARTTSRASSST